ncbi:ABC transporter permease [Enterobacterales bacterium CwR94]|nr:ABC transporter permease [Enterobacterales bacterium CwR94]
MMMTLSRFSVRQKLGLILLLLVFALAFLPPLLGFADPLQQDLLKMLGSPEAAAPFGYDHLGRSMLARLSAALQLSLGLAVVCVCTALLPGVLLGLLAAWYGGAVERLLSGIAAVCLALPGLLLVLLLAALVPDSPLMLYIGLSLVLWVEFYRVSCATLRPVVASPALQASRLLGLSSWLLLRRHILPPLFTVMTTLIIFNLITTIMAISALGFISVGIRPPTPELGMMMTELLPWYQEAPWVLMQPVAVLFVLLISLNLLASKEKG